MIKMYSSLKVKDRRKFKADLLKIRELNKKQIEKLTNLWIKPQQDRIKTIDRVLKNQISINEFQHKTKLINEYIAKCNAMFKEV